MNHQRADVLVIGSGAAGGVVSEYLSRHGVRVVCLEQGRWLTSADYPSTGIDYEADARRPQFSFNPNERNCPEDYPTVSGGANPPEIEMVNAVGGTTIHWNCEMMRLQRHDFRGQTTGEQWPITYDELKSYYDLFDAQLGVAGLADDPLAPSRPLHRLPPLQIGSVGEVAGQAFNRLGWHWWPTDLAILSKPYKGRPSCNFNGRGWYGCGTRAKATTAVTHWPSAIRNGARLRAHARVAKILTTNAGRADGALYFDRAGRLHFQPARVVVVCTNGIGTPRLLLNSSSSRFPDGLANSSGLVGRGLMLHVWRRLRGTVGLCIDNYRGPIYNPISSHQFERSDPARGFSGGFTILVRGLNGPLSTASRQKVPWGVEHQRIMRSEFPHVLSVSILGEDMPDDKNRVTLEHSKNDCNGIPAAKVEYSIGENGKNLLEFGRRRARELLEVMGAREILDDGAEPGTSHFMGTARMGDDSRKSVVNHVNQSHDIPNLFIVDGSSFVSGGAVGPTATIGALALRCAEYIVRQRRSWS